MALLLGLESVSWDFIKFIIERGGQAYPPRKLADCVKTVATHGLSTNTMLDPNLTTLEISSTSAADVQAAFHDRALQHFHECTQNFMIDGRGNHRELKAALQIFPLLSKLQGSCKPAFKLFLEVAHSVFPLCWRWLRQAHDMTLLLHDEALLGLCKRIVATQKLNRIEYCYKALLQTKLEDGYNLHMGTMPRFGRRVDTRALLPRSMQYLEECRRKPTVRMIVFKATSHRLPTELVEAVCEAMYDVLDLAPDTKSIWAPFDPTKEAFINAQSSDQSDSDWPILPPKRCWLELDLEPTSGRPAERENLVLWSKYDHQYVWYHKMVKHDTGNTLGPFFWTRCHKQPRFRTDGHSDEYLYHFATTMSDGCKGWASPTRS